MAVKLSKRLQAIADFVPKGAVVADVGCDHGYIPIYLLEQGISPKAIAMDVRKGPLERAKEHIAVHQLDACIETRLSDGLQNLNPKDADTVIIAGMGGGLVKKILTEGAHVRGSIRQFILQPQSEIEAVRAYLREQGLLIVAENMIYEDGKYYPMMLVQPGACMDHEDPVIQDVYDRYGPCLLKQAHPILLQYLESEEQLLLQIADSLKQAPDSPRTQMRMKEVQTKQMANRQAQEIWRHYGT